MNYLSKLDDPRKLITLLGDFPVLRGTVAVSGGTAVFQDGTVKVTAEFTGHPTGITKRCDTVQNISQKPITLRTALSRFQLNSGEYEVYTQYSQWTRESQGAWQELTALTSKAIQAHPSISAFKTATPSWILEVLPPVIMPLMSLAGISQIRHRIHQI